MGNKTMLQRLSDFFSAVNKVAKSLSTKNSSFYTVSNSSEGTISNCHQETNSVLNIETRSQNSKITSNVPSECKSSWLEKLQNKIKSFKKEKLQSNMNNFRKQKPEAKKYYFFKYDDSLGSSNLEKPQPIKAAIAFEDGSRQNTFLSTPQSNGLKTTAISLKKDISCSNLNNPENKGNEIVNKIFSNCKLLQRKLKIKTVHIGQAVILSRPKLSKTESVKKPKSSLKAKKKHKFFVKDSLVAFNIKNSPKKRSNSENNSSMFSYTFELQPESDFPMSTGNKDLKTLVENDKYKNDPPEQDERRESIIDLLYSGIKMDDDICSSKKLKKLRKKIKSQYRMLNEIEKTIMLAGSQETNRRSLYAQ